MLGIPARRDRRLGLVLKKLFTQHRNVPRRFDAEADAIPLHRHDLDRDVEVGQNDGLVKTASQDQHSRTPFETVQEHDEEGILSRR